MACRTVGPKWVDQAKAEAFSAKVSEVLKLGSDAAGDGSTDKRAWCFRTGDCHRDSSDAGSTNDVNFWALCHLF